MFRFCLVLLSFAALASVKGRVIGVDKAPGLKDVEVKKSGPVLPPAVVAQTPKLSVEGRVIGEDKAPGLKDVEVKKSGPVLPPAVVTQTPKPEVKPIIYEDRAGIDARVCPEGFIRRGGFCFPEEEEE